MKAAKKDNPLWDKRSWHNLLYALLAHKRRINQLQRIVIETAPRGGMRERLKFHKAVAERDMLTRELKLTMIASGASKQRAAIIIRRFLD